MICHLIDWAEWNGFKMIDRAEFADHILRIQTQ